MNWIKQNKFLSGFLAITLVVAGVLTFLMTTAMGRANTAQSNYEAASTELNRLQTSAPYPDADNLAQMEELKKKNQSAIDELQRELAKKQIAMTPGVTPAQFQDKLKEVVTKVRNSATTANVKLGTEQAQKFYMSFDRYETEQPKPEAAAPLLRMLESMEVIVDLLIANNVSEISEIKHEPLPEEGGKKDTAKAAAKEEKALVVRHPFEVSFVAHEGKFHKFINNVVTQDHQFFIPRSVTVKNEKEQGPSRSAADAPAPSAPADSPSSGSNEGNLKLIVGEEKVLVTVKLDVIDFAVASAAKGDASAAPAKGEK